MVKWMALNWPFVIIAIGVLTTLAVVAKNMVSTTLERRHERTLEVIRAQTAQLPHGSSLSDAERTLALNTAIDLLDELVEASSDPLIEISLGDLMKDTEAFLKDVKSDQTKNLKEVRRAMSDYHEKHQQRRSTS